jgi:hypothetical protein
MREGAITARRNYLMRRKPAALTGSPALRAVDGLEVDGFGGGALDHLPLEQAFLKVRKVYRQHPLLLRRHL